MLAATLLSFAVSLLAPWIVQLARERSGWVLALLPAGLTLYFASFLNQISAGEVIRQSVAWLPGLGINLSFYLDGLSLLFALLISGIGTFIVIYAGGYMKNDPTLGRFYLVLLAFMAAMLGLVLSDNLITLFVFWELTSITSYFLVGYKHDYEDSRNSALQALLVTGTGGLAMLAGFLMLGVMTSSLEISQILTQAGLIQEHPLYLAMLILVLLGALTKSAQFPFHFWLPNAMAAPTPVSAYLHSATMVKAGIYLMARLSPGLAGTSAWLWIVGTAGALTVITAAILAFRQTDLKRLLAYSTVIALGTLTMLLAIGSTAAIKAMVVFLLGHSLYKACLFMTAGSIDHEAGSRDINEVSGLRRVMPITFVASLLAAISLAGLPPQLGFIGKELAYEGLLGHLPLLIASVAANIGIFVVAALVIIKPYFGQLRSARTVHETPLSMWLGPLILASLGLVFALFPQLIEPSQIATASAVLGSSYTFSLYLFPASFTPALGLSILTVSLGVVAVLLWPRLYQFLMRISPALDIGPAKAYDRILEAIVWLAKEQTRLIQGPNLRRHLFVLITVLVALTGFTLLSRHSWQGFPAIGTIYFYELMLAGLIVAGALTTVFANTRLTAVTALGVTGFGIALIFVTFAAPDLAITQFLVETLLVIILVLVMIRLPELSKAENSPPASQFRDALIAIGSGILVTALLLTVITIPFNETVSDFLKAESMPGGFGRNIVNVILVDFRALDTLGEIVVLAIAAAGVAALLTRRRSKRKADKRS